jgi:alpha-glucosidase
MGTWGPGLFESDSAQDFLDELAGVEAGDRASVLARGFRELLADPSLLWRSILPEPLIAAAALVALGLPGGQRIRDSQRDVAQKAVTSAMPDRPAPELAADALGVLTIVAAPDGSWNTGWRRPEDRDDALSNIEAVRRVLESALLEPPSA